MFFFQLKKHFASLLTQFYKYLRNIICLMVKISVYVIFGEGFLLLGSRYLYVFFEAVKVGFASERTEQREQNDACINFAES